MKNKVFYLLLLFIGVILTPNNAYADIWDSLSGKANVIGKGLSNVGHVIAGFALIAFSVAAIFNKISWKTLAYIMISCFIVGITTMVVDEVHGEAEFIGYLDHSSSASANVETPGNVKDVSVKK